MAHFAILGPENIVQKVLVVDNSIAITEKAGIDFLRKTFNDNNLIVIQTSYNNNIRKNYAGIGYTYDSQRDAFIPPKPYNSWILDEQTCNWKSPIPLPDNVNPYTWNEDIINWEAKTRQ
jgi:hypothetical protein